MTYNQHIISALEKTNNKITLETADKIYKELFNEGINCLDNQSKLFMNEAILVKALINVTRFRH